MKAIVSESMTKPVNEKGCEPLLAVDGKPELVKKVVLKVPVEK